MLAFLSLFISCTFLLVYEKIRLEVIPKAQKFYFAAQKMTTNDKETRALKQSLYRALRELEARAEHYATTYSADGYVFFRYQIIFG